MGPVADKAAFEESLARLDGDGGSPVERTPSPEGPKSPSRKRRRKPKEPPPTDIVGACAEGWNILFGVVARSHGDKWKLSKEESKRLGYYSAAVIHKYVPDLLDRFAEEIALGFCLVGVWLVRRYPPTMVGETVPNDGAPATPE